MQLEKRNQKMLTTISVVVLAAILLIIFAGVMIQGQNMPLKDKEMSNGSNPFMVPESAQSGQIGELVVSVGILLLSVGFGVLVVMLWVGRKSTS